MFIFLLCFVQIFLQQRIVVFNVIYDFRMLYSQGFKVYEFFFL